MKKKIKAIIIDLDGTLCDCEHRRKLRSNGKIDFGHFLDPENVKKDPINIWCAELIHAMEERGYYILYVSGREDSLYDTTEYWLGKHQIANDNLYMRKSGDYRKDCDVKTEIYNKHIKDKYAILFVVDDRKQVVDMWREMGMTVLHCAEGNF